MFRTGLWIRVKGVLGESRYGIRKAKIRIQNFPKEQIIRMSFNKSVMVFLGGGESDPVFLDGWVHISFFFVCLTCVQLIFALIRDLDKDFEPTCMGTSQM